MLPIKLIPTPTHLPNKHNRNRKPNNTRIHANALSATAHAIIAHCSPGLREKTSNTQLNPIKRATLFSVSSHACPKQLLVDVKIALCKQNKNRACAPNQEINVTITLTAKFDAIFVDYLMDSNVRAVSFNIIAHVLKSILD
jgi:hypothetical protein